MEVFYVYIMSNLRHTVFYTGFTDELERRVYEHKMKLFKHSFTARYNCTKLLYYEEFHNVDEAGYRERQLKRYRRAWKINLIKSMNPDWKDLSSGWYEDWEITD